MPKIEYTSDFVKEEVYNFLVELLEEETDRHIVQNINGDLGYIWCAKEYNIEFHETDIYSFIETYKIHKGIDDGEEE